MLIFVPGVFADSEPNRSRGGLCPQATCTEAEASKRLAEALAAAEAASKALEEERGTSAGLQDQLAALQEQLTRVGRCRHAGSNVSSRAALCAACVGPSASWSLPTGLHSTHIMLPTAYCAGPAGAAAGGTSPQGGV